LLAYLLLLLMVWIGAFFADVMQLLFGAELPTSSLISAEGVRWAIRTALPSIGAVPWGMVMLLVATYGLLRGSGLVKVLVRLLCLRRLTLSEWRALLFSLAATVCYVALLYMSAVAPWNILSGVTHEPALSPLLQGWVLLLFIGTLFVSLIYGFIYGNFRSIMDVVVSTADTFVLFIPAIMALLPASGIVPCLQYAGVQQASDMLWSLIETVLYMLPFLYVLFMEIRCK
jgi:p-aminobenzoyl-glutamate transporter AbgT